MKKLFVLVIAMCAWTALAAQTNVGNKVNYYGIDFSKTKVFGATESEWAFAEAFDNINALVIAEWAKYNPGKFLDKIIAIRDISPTILINNEIEPSELIANSADYGIYDEDIAGMIGRYKLKETKGTGLVIVGVLFDKPEAMGYFVVVYFDIASREVLSSYQIVGKAGGFGLRNYWAKALFNALRGK